MKLADLDRHPDGSTPLAAALQWLDALIQSPEVRGDPAERVRAAQALDAARTLMRTDVLTIVAVVADEAMPALPLPEARQERQPARAGVRKPGTYSEAMGGYVGGIMWGEDGTPHACGTCVHSATAMHQEPCSRCVIGVGDGAGHADRWQPRPIPPEAPAPTRWQDKAAEWLARADEQDARNRANPAHADAYPSWRERMQQFRRLANDVERAE